MRGRVRTAEGTLVEHLVNALSLGGLLGRQAPRLGRQFMYATGIAELAALALFWWPGLELVGAAGLALVLVGALATLIRHREGPSHMALSALTLLLVIVQSYRSTVA